MRRFLLILVVFPLGLSACAMFDRSDSSGYAPGENDTPSTAQDFYRERRNKAALQAREELGIGANQDLSENEADAVRARVELSRLEKGLQFEIEKKQYFTLKPFLKNDRDRIYFLNLPTRDARERWARIKGISTDESKFDPVTTQMIEANDVSRGMSRTAVKQSWGEPDFVEIAGNPMYGNERWKYNKQVSTEDGYRQETRIVYFESGRVMGWETL